MKKIDISTKTHLNTFTMVSDDAFDELSQHKWHAQEMRGNLYVMRTAYENDSKVNLGMHRVIMRAGKGVIVDHRDGNTLNNQRYNLRICTNRQNVCNQKLSSANTSGYKGVSWSKEYCRWGGYITSNRKHIYLARHICAYKIAGLYDKAAIKYFGEYALVNGVECNCL